MTVFTSLGIVILSMLILSFFQFIPGTFSLLSHYTLGKYSTRKASDLALFFIFGVETFIILLFILIYFIILALSNTLINFDHRIINFTLGGILVALAFYCLIFYYRKSKGSKIFIPRSIARTFDAKAKNVKCRSDAYALGFISSLPEIIFTLPLFIISTYEIMSLGETPILRASLILVSTMIAISPLLIIHTLFSQGFNLANIQKFRVKKKQFFRFFLSFLYLLIAIIICKALL